MEADRLVRVYGLFDAATPARVRYIGVTVKPLRHRLGQHLRHSRKGTLEPLPAWIREIGENSVRAVALEECVWATRHEREAHWILEKETLRERWPDGFNDALGALISTRQRELIRVGNRRAWAHAEYRSERAQAVAESRRTPAQRASSSLKMKLQRADPATTELYRAASSKAGRVSTHRRHHEARSLMKPGCEFCEKTLGE